MDNKDFFDEEYDKVSENERQRSEQRQDAPSYDDERQRQTEAWYSYDGGTPSNSQPPAKQSGGGKKALWISLVCVGLVLAIVFGWVLCAVFGGNRGNQDEEILSEVLQYLRNNYYKDIPEDKWQEAIAEGGTAILQTAGDQFCRLMTPQQFYDYLYQVDSGSDSVLPTMFGVAFQFVDGLGLYVTEVVADGSCYGLLQEGDIIVKLSDVQYAFLSGGGPSEYDLSKCDADEFGNVLQHRIESAKFHVLRNGQVEITDVIKRGGVGVANPKYDFQFVEFYFGDDCCNVSITNQNRATTNTKALRHLDQLPANTGYVRLSSFMYYMDDNDNEVTAADEFKQVMQLFKSRGLKYLVLDLKGNPGGRVDAATQIASMLVTDAKLTDAQKSAVHSGQDAGGNQKLLLTTLIPKNTSYSQKTALASTYTNYFATPASADALCDVVVWTDGGSASASELLTGAMRDYKTGFQMGTTTYGKGIAQSIEPLPFTGHITTINGTNSTGNWAIYYTSASYYSPLGTNIHGKGYTPSEGYNNLTTYSELWSATKNYWGIQTA